MKICDEIHMTILFESGKLRIHPWGGFTKLKNHNFYHVVNFLNDCCQNWLCTWLKVNVYPFDKLLAINQIAWYDLWGLHLIFDVFQCMVLLTTGDIIDVCMFMFRINDSNFMSFSPRQPVSWKIQKGSYRSAWHSVESWGVTHTQTITQGCFHNYGDCHNCQERNHK